MSPPGRYVTEAMKNAVLEISRDLYMISCPIIALGPSMKCSHSHELNNTIDPSCTDEPLEESLNHLKEVNKKLINKYNNQREFVSLAAHELRSPILPILGTLELIEYEFEESDKKKLH
ncbi:MAG: hypothetical protein WBE68_09990 [Candidatus Nitrosopolaris sp.]